MHRVSVLFCKPSSREFVKWQQRFTDAFHYNHAPAHSGARKEKSLKTEVVFLCIHHCILIANGPMYVMYMTDMSYTC